MILALSISAFVIGDLIFICGIIALFIKKECGRLHITPVKFLQRLGAKPASIAWQFITDVRPVLIGKRMSANIGKHKITGPVCCLQLALQDEDELQEPLDDLKG